MEVSIRKIGNAQGIIFPNELNLEVGARYRIEQSGPLADRPSRFVIL